MKVATKNKIRLYWEYYKYYSFFAWCLALIFEIAFLIIPFCLTGIASPSVVAVIILIFIVSLVNYGVSTGLRFISLYPWDIKEKYFYKWIPFEPEK